MAKTLFEKIWDLHLVAEKENSPSLLYVDRHLIHEVTSPQAFDGLRMNNRKVRRPDLTIATMDHNVPTNDRSFAYSSGVGTDSVTSQVIPGFVPQLICGAISSMHSVYDFSK